jgi:hypothetical protein
LTVKPEGGGVDACRVRGVGHLNGCWCE